MVAFWGDTWGTEWGAYEYPGSANAESATMFCGTWWGFGFF